AGSSSGRATPTASRSPHRTRSFATSSATAPRTSRRSPASRRLLLALLALLACGPVAAQDDAERRIAGCAASATPAERIACLERHVRELAGSPAPAAAGDVEPPAPAPAPAPQVTDAPAPTATEDAPVDTAGPAASPAPAAVPAVELGAEQVEARRRGGDAPATRVTATAVDFRFDGYE